MKNQTYRGLILMLLALSIYSCQNIGCNLKDRNLTPETRSGANTMSCLIDGKVWVANGLTPIKNRTVEGNCKLGGGFDTASKKLVIHGLTDHKCARQQGRIVIYVDTTRYRYVASIKRYDLMLDIDTTRQWNLNAGSYGQFFTNDFNDKHTSYRDEHKGWLELSRYDTVSGIISGRFEFYAQNANNPKRPLVHISQGRFDINNKKMPPCIPSVFIW